MTAKTQTTTATHPPQELVVPKDVEDNVAALVRAYPFRIVFAAKSPQGEWSWDAVHDMRRPKKLARRGYFVMIAKKS